MTYVATPPELLTIHKRKNKQALHRNAHVYASHRGHTYYTHWLRLPNGPAVLVCYGEALIEYNKNHEYELVAIQHSYSLPASYHKITTEISSFAVSRFRRYIPGDFVYRKGTYHLRWTVKVKGEHVYRYCPLFFGLRIKDGRPVNAKDCPKEHTKHVKVQSQNFDERRRRLRRASDANTRAVRQWSEVLNKTRKKEDFDVAQIFHIRNAQTRTTAIEYFGGVSVVFKDLPREEMCRETVQGRLYIILDIQIQTAKQITSDSRTTTRTWQMARYNQPAARGIPMDVGLWGRYLLMINPSTGEEHLEGIPNDCQSIRNALSWRDGDAPGTTYIEPTLIS